MATTLLFANNATTTIAANMNTSVTTVTVATGAGALFPSPTGGNYFMCTLVDAATGLVNEIVKCTARSGDVITIVRAQESTTAKSWLIGDKIGNFWTGGQAATMLQQNQAQAQAANYAVDTGAVNAMVITLSPVPASLSDLIGAPIRIKVNVTNTNVTPTLNVNGLGAQNVVTVGAGGIGGISVGGAAATKIIEVVWDGTNFQFQLRVGTASTAMIQAGTDFVSPITSLNLRGAMAFSTIGVVGNYQYLPTGVLIQWGTTTSSTGVNDPVSFPVTFPNAIVGLTLTGDTSNGFLNVCALGRISGGHQPTTSGFQFGTGQLSAAVPPPATGVPVRWIAIGY